jgi:hypothetical protein
MARVVVKPGTRTLSGPKVLPRPIAGGVGGLIVASAQFDRASESVPELNTMNPRSVEELRAYFDSFWNSKLDALKRSLEAEERDGND